MHTELDPNLTMDVPGILEDLDELRDQPPSPGPRCGVATALARLDDYLAAAVAERVNDDRYPAAGVAGILAARTGVHVAAYTIRRHRKRGAPDGCRCPR